MNIGSISNPEVDPVSISISDYPQITPEHLAEFKRYLSVDTDHEDVSLIEHLQSVADELAHPTSIGIPVYPMIWTMTVELRGKMKVYLPRFRQGSFGFRSFDGDSNEVHVDWNVAPEPQTIYPSIRLLQTDSLNGAVTATFSWQVAGMTSAVKRLLYIEAGFRREFPLGVGDRGESLVERPPAAQLIRDEWQPIYDLYNYR